jgi:HEPN domain-containing protein
LIKQDIEAGGYDWACFKSQQAAELALKAVLKAIGRSGFGHNLIALYREVKEVCYDEEELMNCVWFLDKLCVPPRHPDAFTEGEPWQYFTENESKRASRCAKIKVGREVCRPWELKRKLLSIGDGKEKKS